MRQFDSGKKILTHWVKEIDIKRYGDGLQIISVTSSVEIYSYSYAQLKHLPRGSLKTVEKMLLYRKKSSVSSRRRSEAK